MNPLASLSEHHLLCDELHQLALEENRHWRTRERAPDEAFLARKRSLLQRLDDSLAALRVLPAASARAPAARTELEQTRARILQILQLDQENEQLLLRCSLASTRPAAASVTPSAAMLQKIYSRCT